MAMEARAVRRGVRYLSDPVQVLCTGMGPKRSRRVGLFDKPVVVVGIAGAVTDEIAPGEVVVATDVSAHDVAPIGLAQVVKVAQDIRNAGFTVHTGSVACVSRLAVGARRQELADMGAVAVDMESAWLLERQRRPAAVVRVVTDTPSHELRSLSAPAAVFRALRTIRRIMPALVTVLVKEVC